MKDDCIIWTGHRDPNGYGRVSVPGHSTYAHRFAYEEVHGEIPPGMSVLHTCDVPSCVNPVHLYLGTQADNVRDRDARGRTAKGKRADYQPIAIHIDVSTLPPERTRGSEFIDVRYTAIGLRAALKERGSSVTWLAARTGIPRTVVNDLVHLKRTADAERAKVIADTLGLPVDSLFT